MENLAGKAHGRFPPGYKVVLCPSTAELQLPGTAGRRKMVAIDNELIEEKLSTKYISVHNRYPEPLPGYDFFQQYSASKMMLR